MMLIVLITFSFNLLFKSKVIEEIEINHRKEAVQKPKMKYRAVLGGSEAWKPPKSKEPSIIAWGLSQVTTKQVKNICNKELLLLSIVFSISPASLINLNPIKITKIEPTNKMVLFREGTFLSKRPIPKKQANAKRISKMIVKPAT